MHSLQLMKDGKVQYMDSETGEPVEYLGDEEVSFDEASTRRIWKHWSETEKGTDFYQRFYDNSENQKTLIKVFTRLYPDDERVTVGRLNDAFDTALLSGSFVEPKPAELAALARDQQGRFANQLVLEYHNMLNDPLTPASAISARMRADAAFRAAVESVAVPEPQRHKGPIVSEKRKAELTSFADAFRREPSPKFLAGFVSIGGVKYSKAEYEAAINEASSLNLL